MIQHLRAGFLLLLCLTAAPLPAWAGVVIEQEAKNTETGEVVRMVSYVEPGRLRMEAQGSAGTLITIFRADRQVVWTIQPAEKSYQEITQADVDRMAGQLAEMRKRQEAMLKDLPPEQRAMVEQMMKQQMGGTRPLDVRVNRLGAESVGKFTTTKYEILTDGERTAELWATPLAQVELQPAEYETFLQFTRFFKKLSQAAARQMASTQVLARHPEAIEGFPVRVLSYEEGELVSEQQLVRVERQPLAEDKFQLPPGLRKVQMPGPEL
ncbi:MAG: DUF4412 domain-containing protein [Terriglobia bacterium]